MASHKEEKGETKTKSVEETFFLRCVEEEALTSAIGATHGCVSAESCCHSVRQGAHRHLSGKSTPTGQGEDEKKGFSSCMFQQCSHMISKSKVEARRRTALIRARHAGANSRLVDDGRT